MERGPPLRAHAASGRVRDVLLRLTPPRGAGPIRGDGGAAWAVLIVCIAALGALSAWRGADANWDERNYHLYAGWAALRGRLDVDIAPAQAQTFAAPALDALRAGLRALAGPNRLSLALAAVPQAAAVAFAFRIALLVAPGRGAWRMAAALAAAALGATGAASLSTVGSSMSEMPDGAFFLLATLLLMRALDRPGLGALAASGACLGVAAGLRLPAAPLCLGAAVSCAVCLRAPPARRALGLAVLAAAALACLLAVAGPWQLALLRRFGNPLFPWFNDVFASPDLPPGRFADERFLPDGVLEAIFYPFRWALDQRPRASELALRDPRLAVAWCGVVLAPFLARTRRAAFLAILLAVAYAAWAALFGVLRYLAPVELLAGAAAMLPMGRLTARQATACLLAVLAVCAGATVYPDWGHAVGGAAAARVRPPDFGPGSLVVLLDGAPMAYVAAFSDPAATFAGADSNLIGPGRGGGLARRVEAAVRGWQGPLWGLEEPSEAPAAADRTLAYYGLVRAPGCVRVASNLDADAITACPLRRATDRPDRSP